MEVGGTFLDAVDRALKRKEFDVDLPSRIRFKGAHKIDEKSFLDGVDGSVDQGEACDKRLLRIGLGRHGKTKDGKNKNCGLEDISRHAAFSQEVYFGFL